MSPERFLPRPRPPNEHTSRPAQTLWESLHQHSGLSTLTSGRLGYTGRARTTARTLQRSARALTHSAVLRSPTLIAAFWWEEVKNFGDLITPLLLRDLGIIPILTPAARAALIGVGSLIQHIDDNYSGTIWGAGLIANTPRSIPAATTLALRGELTREQCGSPHVEALGDPGLLLAEYISRQPKRWDVGLVPHYVHVGDSDLTRLLQSASQTVTVVNVQSDPLRVARHIAACRTIITTSLHGLIVADSLGIPALWLRMPRALSGGDFKFRDHESVVRPSRPRGMDIHDVESMAHAVSVARRANAQRVEHAIGAIKRSGRMILDVTRHETTTLPRAIMRSVMS
ncbi:polysaccharide pyruvyl transferase family protein [Dermatophilus congolensis]|uniref:polysaccharide pyruvyl transferase family protein n=1 Tax=Dermatophilus congolensis TaxID=1863 RepID=UPI001AAE2624|nr:polysaccharide pyruvyl transferase family protein [Dermatophilus congolensis]MBO3143009.1 polysaccharide pyruvyl transferase family protein [Dermatophilus congolensis]MBO3151997.1 polysaccharide pyruvyl transferase family protein [Dermatophilus congolensis]MBO3160994.1 polysaccharide pyruvyl transferase family protein [Dermatophilus congolensis]MBO3163282.1 polysaccharide pyruvyl transferase family protein [Dermatophilus congolensis]MBO3176839.1 polysaccharide pyruvyl transferase family pro